MMRTFLLLCISVGFCTGASIRDLKESESTTVNTEKSSDSQNVEPFEVFALESYNAQEPLVIRSRIPDSLRINSQADLKNNKEGSILEGSIPTPNDQAKEYIINSFESFQPSSDSQQQIFQQNLPFSSLSLSDSNQEAHLSSLNTLPNIAFNSEFASLLDSESSVGVGLTSLDIKESSQNAASTFAGPGPEQKQSSLVLIPAPLQYTAVGNADALNNKQEIPISELQAGISTRTNEEADGYTIERVPEVASYSKTGPFTPSDIPSFSQIEAIFNISSHKTTAIENGASDSSEESNRQAVEGRAGLEENSTENSTDIVDETTTINQAASVENRDKDINNVISNEIGEDSDVASVTSNELVISSQPLSNVVLDSTNRLSTSETTSPKKIGEDSVGLSVDVANVTSDELIISSQSLLNSDPLNTKDTTNPSERGEGISDDVANVTSDELVISSQSLNVALDSNRLNTNETTSTDVLAGDNSALNERNNVNVEAITVEAIQNLEAFTSVSSEDNNTEIPATVRAETDDGSFNGDDSSNSTSLLRISDNEQETAFIGADESVL